MKSHYMCIISLAEIDVQSQPKTKGHGTHQNKKALAAIVAACPDTAWSL